MALPFLPTLTVVIPAFNERENLPVVTADLLRFLETAAPNAEILIIDDGSSDGTVEAIPPDSRTRVIKHAMNRGLTASLRTGFFAAQSEFVTWVPADGQIPAGELGKILAAWQGEDLILSTYRQRPDGPLRALMSTTLRLLLRLSIGFRDRLEGTYLFRRSLLNDFQLVARTSAGSIGFEIGAKTRVAGRRIGSTEIECAPRMSGRSKVANAKNVLGTLGELWRIRQSMRG